MVAMGWIEGGYEVDNGWYASEKYYFAYFFIIVSKKILISLVQNNSQIQHKTLRTKRL